MSAGQTDTDVLWRSPDYWEWKYLSTPDGSRAEAFVTHFDKMSPSRRNDVFANVPFAKALYTSSMAEIKAANGGSGYTTYVPPTSYIGRVGVKRNGTCPFGRSPMGGDVCVEYTDLRSRAVTSAALKPEGAQCPEGFTDEEGFCVKRGELEKSPYTHIVRQQNRAEESFLIPSGRPSDKLGVWRESDRYMACNNGSGRAGTGVDVTVPIDIPYVNGTMTPSKYCTKVFRNQDVPPGQYVNAVTQNLGTPWNSVGCPNGGVRIGPNHCMVYNREPSGMSKGGVLIDNVSDTSKSGHVTRTIPSKDYAKTQDYTSTASGTGFRNAELMKKWPHGIKLELPWGWSFDDFNTWHDSTYGKLKKKHWDLIGYPDKKAAVHMTEAWDALKTGIPSPYLTREGKVPDVENGMVEKYQLAHLAAVQDARNANTVYVKSAMDSIVACKSSDTPACTEKIAAFCFNPHLGNFSGHAQQCFQAVQLNEAHRPAFRERYRRGESIPNVVRSTIMPFLEPPAPAVDPSVLPSSSGPSVMQSEEKLGPVGGSKAVDTNVKTDKKVKDFIETKSKPQPPPTPSDDAPGPAFTTSSSAVPGHPLDSQEPAPSDAASGPPSKTVKSHAAFEAKSGGGVEPPSDSAKVAEGPSSNGGGVGSGSGDSDSIDAGGGNLNEYIVPGAIGLGLVAAVVFVFKD